jgi:hypothetical protein
MAAPASSIAYYCHSCSKYVQMPFENSLTCPVCKEDFIEQMDQTDQSVLPNENIKEEESTLDIEEFEELICSPTITPKVSNRSADGSRIHFTLNFQIFYLPFIRSFDPPPFTSLDLTKI